MSNTTNATYMFNTNATDANSAEAWCASKGSHLVSYGSLEEQVEVSVLRRACWAAAPQSYTAYVPLRQAAQPLLTPRPAV